MTLPFTPKRLIIAQHKVDYRKQWNGLLGECYRIGFDPYAGDCVVFLKRDRSQMRILCGDCYGLFMVSRRFDGGCLTLDWKFVDAPTAKSISMRELRALLSGLSTVTRRVKTVKIGLAPENDLS